MSITSSLRRLALDWAAQRRLARTLRVMDSLPDEIRKDVGWPGGPRPYRRGTGRDATCVA